MLASIPSPSFNEIALGPLSIHIYGIAIALGVLAAITVTTRRYAKFGGNPAILDSVLLWTILLGFLGARLAYISTHFDRYEGRWQAMLYIWEGGLALYGGLTAGAITAVVMVRRRRGDPWTFADAAAVGLPLAQGIGRWGNYFNQELFGTPTDLPWGLEIAPQFRPAEFADFATFHPTFLYESLANLLIVIPVILWLERKRRLPRGGSISVYLVMYGLIRFGTELLRTDTTFRFLGLSRNGWVSIGIVLGGLLVLAWRRRVGKPQGLTAGEQAEGSGDPEVEGATDLAEPGTDIDVLAEDASVADPDVDGTPVSTAEASTPQGESLTPDVSTESPSD